MKRKTTSWDTVLIAAIVALASVCGQSQAQEAEEGKVVQIAPAGAADNLDIEDETRLVEAPTYWIGIRGRSIESDILRTHLQLAEDMGVVVEDVLDGSPAAQAGLRKHDIILRCNGDAVDNLQVLQSQVRTGQDQPLELKIVRLGNKETIVVVPELRPERVGERIAPLDPLGRGVRGDAMQRLMEQLGARNIGPGMVFRGGGRGMNLNEMPSGVSVSVQRNNNEPARITVKKGDQTWQIVGDDAEALQQLPDDVRPFVERMLNGQNNFQGFGGAFDFRDLNAEIEQLLPRGLGNFRPPVADRLRGQFQQQEDQLKQRMEEMEKRLQQLQERIESDGPALPTS
ncbi:MAG: PDZ domain-containing protein [Bythopirellula sp.]